VANGETARLAVLIDADNASASVVKELLEEVAKYGTATVKRAYGDWTTQNLVGWKEHLHRHAIQPIQQFAYTKGKNSTDSAFIIDAMDLLYAGNVDGFCIVSSDSDFTRLATRMREAGKVVYGLGERKAPEPFMAACDKFIFFEVLKKPAEAAAPVQVADVPDLKSCCAFGNSPQEALAEVQVAMDAWLAAARDAGLAIPKPHYQPHTEAAE